MNLKKEDEDYIYDSVNQKESVSKNSKPLDYFKTQDKIVLILSFAGIILAAILGVLFTPMGGTINIFILLLIGALFGFSASYIILSFILGILLIFFKRLKEDYITFTIKMVISSAVVIVVVVLLFINSFNMSNGSNFNPTTAVNQLIKIQIQNPEAESCTAPVVFQRNSSLVAEGITKDIGLDSIQIYFDNPQQINMFDVNNFQILKYTEDSSKKVVMCIICSEGKSGLEEALIQNGINTIIDSNIEDETLCLVYPRKLS